MQLCFNILSSAALYILLAASFSLIYYPTKLFHLSHAATITLGAYFAYLLNMQLQLPLPIAIILSIIFAITIGALNEIGVYRIMRKKNLAPFSYLIASIGIYIVLQNLISLTFGDDTKIIRTGEVTVGNEFFGAYITNTQILAIVVSVGLFVLMLIVTNYTTIGKQIRAVSSNPELCNIYGINSDRVILIAFCIGSALAAVAGILSAMDTNMTPTFGFNLLLYAVVAMIIGGVGSTRGLVAGAMLVAAAQQLAAYYIDTKWMDAVTYIILITFLIWRPLGFSGKHKKSFEV